jgi:hypothetical protein
MRGFALSMLAQRLAARGLNPCKSFVKIRLISCGFLRFCVMPHKNVVHHFCGAHHRTNQAVERTITLVT